MLLKVLEYEHLQDLFLIVEVIIVIVTEGNRWAMELFERRVWLPFGT